MTGRLRRWARVLSAPLAAAAGLLRRRWPAAELARELGLLRREPVVFETDDPAGLLRRLRGGRGGTDGLS